MPFPVDAKYIESTEQKLGVSFPASFRGKMLRMNGGSIDACDDTWELYPFLDASDKKRIARTCNDIAHETEQALQWDKFPRGAVAIAGNGTADQLLFLPKSEAPQDLDAAIYWWDHETGELEKVADDFADLP